MLNVKVNDAYCVVKTTRTTMTTTIFMGFNIFLALYH